jgi:Na+-driven multidrug efflux pump
MTETIRTARTAGLVISFACLLLFEVFAVGVTKLFMSTNGKDAQTALITLGYAALFLRIRCIASPFQFTNYHSSYCMQAMGNGRGTMLHAFVRELVFYIPFMFILDHFFGEKGLACALIAGEACGAVFALYLVHRTVSQSARRAAETAKDI